MAKRAKTLAGLIVAFLLGAGLGSNFANDTHDDIDPLAIVPTVSVDQYYSARLLAEQGMWDIAYADDLGRYYERKFEQLSKELDDCDEILKNHIQLLINSDNVTELIKSLKKRGREPVFQDSQEHKALLGWYLEAKRKRVECQSD